MRFHFPAILIAVLLISLPASGENTVPPPPVQEKLIKTYLLTFNDANITGNYAVLHAKLAKPFRVEYSPEKLKQAFQSFAAKEIDFGIIVTKPPVPTADAKIDQRGALLLRGYFDTAPSRVIYDLDFIVSEGDWKPVRLNVSVRPAGE